MSRNVAKCAFAVVYTTGLRGGSLNTWSAAKHSPLFYSERTAPAPGAGTGSLPLPARLALGPASAGYNRRHPCDDPRLATIRTASLRVNATCIQCGRSVVFL